MYEFSQFSKNPAFKGRGRRNGKLLRQEAPKIGVFFVAIDSNLKIYYILGQLDVLLGSLYALVHTLQNR